MNLLDEVLKRFSVLNLMNCSLAPYDLSKSSSSSRNRPALVFTRDKTVYSQFLKECPHPVIMMLSSVLPWSLCPVMGNWVIFVLNVSGGVSLLIEHFTVVVVVIGSR